MRTSQDIGTVAQFSVRLTIFVFLLVIDAALCFSFVQFPAARPELIFVAGVAGGTAGIYSAFYAGQSLRRNFHLALMNNAYSLLALIHNIDTMRARAILETFDHRSVTPSE